MKIGNIAEMFFFHSGASVSISPLILLFCCWSKFHDTLNFSLDVAHLSMHKIETAAKEMSLKANVSFVSLVASTHCNVLKDVHLWLFLNETHKLLNDLTKNFKMETCSIKDPWLNPQALWHWSEQCFHFKNCYDCIQLCDFGLLNVLGYAIVQHG